LPVFDGDPTDKLFYDANSRKTITGTGPYSVQLLDYPTLVALKTVTSSNNITYNLIRALKYNKFHVLFIVRRSDPADIQAGIWCDYLRDLEWATKVEASFDPGNHFAQLGQGYQSKSESFEPLTKVTVLSPIRRWDMHKVNTANQDQTIKSEKDVLGILEFQDFTIDRYLPTVTV
jgi:hypothetical protein